MGLNRAGMDSARAAEAERLVPAGKVDDDAAFELKLRPTRLDGRSINPALDD